MEDESFFLEQAVLRPALPQVVGVVIGLVAETG